MSYKAWVILPREQYLVYIEHLHNIIDVRNVVHNSSYITNWRRIGEELYGQIKNWKSEIAFFYLALKIVQKRNTDNEVSLHL